MGLAVSASALAQPVTSSGGQAQPPASPPPPLPAPRPSGVTVPARPREAPAFAPGPYGPPSANSLPVPTGRPMEIDFSADPVLRLRHIETTFEPFRAAIASAVENHPGTLEAAANEDEARGALEEARQGQLPTVDLNVTSYRVLSRAFSAAGLV